MALVFYLFDIIKISHVYRQVNLPICKAKTIFVGVWTPSQLHKKKSVTKEIRYPYEIDQ